ncbi:MAG: phage minor capsid protein [Bacillota bacterium]|nr:phage minor capsid protein [Bacillota bacterium]
MLKKSEKQEFSDPGVRIYSDLETLIMQNIIRHVRNYDQLIDSDTWLMQKLAEIGKLNRENMKIIAKTVDLSRTAVEHMLEEVADLVMERVEPDLYETERKGILDQTIPAKKSENVKAAVQAIQKQALDSLNVCNTTMLYMARDAYTRLVQQTAEKAEEIANKQEFLDILGKHATAQIIGAESRQQAIQSTIKEFNEKGIPAFVDKRGREWTPEAYVAMTLRTTAGNTATEAMFARMKDRGLSLIQVSEHPGARPKCAKDQGKIFDRNNNRGITTDLHGKQIPFYPLKESSYGEPDGLFGINCGHHGVPFIPGVSRQRYQPTKDMEENDKLYKKMQTQRSMEREIRKQKRLCSLYDKAGEEEAFEKAAVKLKEKETQLTQYLEKNNSLVRRRDREQVVGFERGISARAVGANKRYQKRLAEKEENDKIIAEIKEIGMKGKVELSPQEKIDVSKFTFDDEHINKEREHLVTREEAERFIQEADVAITRWEGRFVNYYGVDGAVFVDVEKRNIRTAFHKEQFDEHVKEMREVLKKYGKG